MYSLSLFQFVFDGKLYNPPPSPKYLDAVIAAEYCTVFSSPAISVVIENDEVACVTASTKMIEPCDI